MARASLTARTSQIITSVSLVTRPSSAKDEAVFLLSIPLTLHLKYGLIPLSLFVRKRDPMEELSKRIKEFGDPNEFRAAAQRGYTEYSFVSSERCLVCEGRSQQVVGGFILYHPDGKVILGWVPREWLRGKEVYCVPRVEEQVTNVMTLELWLANHAATAEERRPISELLEACPDT